MRDELKQFYQEIQEWVDEGCPPHDVFQRDSGLCNTLEMWCEKAGHDRELTVKLWDEQAGMFTAAGLDKHFPFDTEDSYNEAYQYDAMYTNPKRLAWIKEHAE